MHRIIYTCGAQTHVAPCSYTCDLNRFLHQIVVLSCAHPSGPCSVVVPTAHDQHPKRPRFPPLRGTAKPRRSLTEAAPFTLLLSPRGSVTRAGVPACGASSRRASRWRTPCSKPCCRSCATRCATSALPQWPSPSSRRPTSRRPSATTPPHATPTSHLEPCSRSLPLAARPQAHEGLRQVMNKSRRDTSACASSTRRPRAPRARAHAGGAALTELHSPSWPRVAKKEPMVVIARDSRRGGRRPIVEKELARGGGHQGQRCGSRRSARRGCVWPRPSPRCVEAAVKALSIR